MDEITKIMIHNIISKEDEIIRESLVDLIKQGALIVERTQGNFELDSNYKATYNGAIRLKLRDQEIINDLQQRLDKAEDFIESLEEFLQNDKEVIEKIKKYRE